MKRIHCVFIYLPLSLILHLVVTGCATKPPAQSEPKKMVAAKALHSMEALTISEKAKSPAIFIPHNGDKPLNSYIAMNLNYEPFQKLRKDLEKKTGLKQLTHRGEAHITVITPVEYDQTLKKRVGIKELEDLAKRRGLQDSAFKLNCLGKGTQHLDGKEESTYYVVVSSEDLPSYRKEVQKLFVSRGGRALDFNPDLFYPHVTLGFTKRDLHLEDNIIKDSKSCIYSLKLK